MRSYLGAVALWVAAKRWNVKKVCLKKRVLSDRILLLEKKYENRKSPEQQRKAVWHLSGVRWLA